MCETHNEGEIGAASAIYFDYEHEANLKRILALYKNDRILYDYTYDLLAELHSMWESDMNLSLHKRQHSKSLYKELLPIAWHPDRVLDW